MSIAHLSPAAKLWIYQSNRDFNAEEMVKITADLDAFVTSWQSHGSPLTSGFALLENRFIAIAVDENVAQASGCSIDKSVGIIRELEGNLHAGMLDRGALSYIDASGQIKTITFDQIKPAVLNKEILPETIVFNNNIDQLNLLASEWKIKAENSWLNRYFSKSIVD